MALELIKISEFPQVNEPSEWIAVSDANGIAYKISKVDFKEWLGTVTVVAPKAISPSDPAPTLDGVYKPTIDGTYANAGGLTVNRSEGGEDYGKSVDLLKNGSTWVKVTEPMPQAENKIPDWVAGTYASGQQTNHNGQIWSVDVASTTQEPGDGTDWTPKTEKVSEPTNQILDKSTFVFGYYNNLGIEASSSATIRTGKIKISGGETKISISSPFTLGSSIENRVFFWNEEGDLISAIPSSLNSLQDLSIPTGSVYWGMNIATQTGLTSATDNRFSNTVMANYGSTLLPYENYGVNLIGENIAAIQFENSTNLLDKRFVTYGYWSSEGQRVASSTTFSTGKIPIDSSKGYLSLNEKQPLGTNVKMVFWDSNDVFLGFIDNNSSLKGVPIPTGSYYTAINIASISGGVGDPTNNIYVNTLQLQYGRNITEFETFGRKIKDTVLPITPTFGIEIEILASDSFNVISYHDNGQKVIHGWKKNVKAPQYENGWQADYIRHNNNNIVQGSFNFIHMLTFPNESQHVGIGHGCETTKYVHFYLDGVEFVPEDIIGAALKGNVFSFDIGSVIYAADSATTNADWNGSKVVPQLPLIESTYHYMNGGIKANSKLWNYNKLVILRDGTSFQRAYIGMQLTYRPFFDRVQLHNIENTINDIQTLEPISPATASFKANGGAYYDTSEGWRGELATSATAYSDRFGYIFNTLVYRLKPEVKDKMNVLFAENTSKCYFQPVNTEVISSNRNVPLDVFNRGDVIEGYVERELII